MKYTKLFVYLISLILIACANNSDAGIKVVPTWSVKEIKKDHGQNISHSWVWQNPADPSALTIVGTNGKEKIIKIDNGKGVYLQSQISKISVRKINKTLKPSRCDNHVTFSSSLGQYKLCEPYILGDQAIITLLSRLNTLH